MAYLLCHDCLGWVEPVQNRCSMCTSPIDLSAVDPTPNELQVRIGQIEELLGPVRFLRSCLPTHGHLYATTAGLLFVPHQLFDLVDEESEWKPNTPPPQWWNAVRAVMPQASIMEWFTNRFHDSDMSHHLEVAHQVDKHDPIEGPRLLLHHPGVFFLERTRIDQIRSHRRNWTFFRHESNSIHLRAVADWRSFRTNLQKIMQQPMWQDLVMANSTI